MPEGAGGGGSASNAMVKTNGADVSAPVEARSPDELEAERKAEELAWLEDNEQRAKERYDAAKAAVAEARKGRN